MKLLLVSECVDVVAVVVAVGQVVSVCGLVFLLRRPQQHGRHKARNRLAAAPHRPLPSGIEPAAKIARPRGSATRLVD